MAVNLSKIAENLIQGKADIVKQLTEQALNEGMEAKEILEKGLLGGMSVIGHRFKNNEIFLPEVLVAARAMHAGMDILKPALIASNVKAPARVAIGTVKGDLHDIGKNIVIMMMQGGGFDTIDLGIDVPEEKFIETIKNEDIQILGLSALLTTTMVNMKSIIKKTKEAGLGDRIKIMVGGAPVTQAFADEIGADGFAADAATAVDKAKQILGLQGLF